MLVRILKLDVKHNTADKFEKQIYEIIKQRNKYIEYVIHTYPNGTPENICFKKEKSQKRKV